jgi:hypothetical protein
MWKRHGVSALGEQTVMGEADPANGRIYNAAPFTQSSTA